MDTVPVERVKKQRTSVAVNETTATFYCALDLSGSHSLWGFAKSLKPSVRTRHSTGGVHQSIFLI